MESANDAFTDSIIAKFTITIGDEFQGLVSTDFPFFDFDRFYRQALEFGIKTRFKIGFGTLETDLKGAAVGMDGPCFHHARDALESAKSAKAIFQFLGFPMDIALNALACILQDYEQQWQPRQLDVICLYQETDNQALIGQKLGITRQSVNDILRASKYNLYKQGWFAVQNLIKMSGKID